MFSNGNRLLTKVADIPIYMYSKKKILLEMFFIGNRETVSLSTSNSDYSDYLVSMFFVHITLILQLIISGPVGPLVVVFIPSDKEEYQG